MTPLSGLCGLRPLTRSPRWHYCRISRTDLWPPLTSLYPGQQQLYMFCIARPLSVFVSCFLDVLPCASRLSHSYTHDVCALVSLGLLLRNGDSFTTRNLLLCYLAVRYPVFLISSVHFSLLLKDMFLFKAQKKQFTPLLLASFPASGLFTPLPSLPESESWFYDTSICSLGGDSPIPLHRRHMHSLVILL